MFSFADSASVSGVPSDITAFGILKDIEPQVLNLPTGFEFPVTDKRRFNPKYLNEYAWLEYSISNDAAYCYACRQFSPTHDGDNVFKYSGFSNWKSAGESNKGFKRHHMSAIHVQSMAKWAEAINRRKTKTSVVEVASGNLLQYRRNYTKKIIEVNINRADMIRNRLMGNPAAGSCKVDKHIFQFFFRSLYS